MEKSDEKADEKSDEKAEVKPLSDKERAKRIVESQIYHFRFLEKSMGLDKEWIAKKVGSLRFVLQMLEKLV